MSTPQHDTANSFNSASNSTTVDIEMVFDANRNLEEVPEDQPTEANGMEPMTLKQRSHAIDGLVPANTRIPSSKLIAALSLHTAPIHSQVTAPEIGDLPGHDTIRKRVRGDLFDPFRNSEHRPSHAPPIVLEKTLDIRTKFPVIFDPDYFYHTQSAEAAQQVDQYVHYCNIVKSLMQAGSVFFFGAQHLMWMTLFPDSPEKWWAIEFMTLWTIYAILILKAVRPQKNHYLYRILTQSSIPPKYPRISMAAKQYIWMNQPIGSLSELCHIEGATTTYGLTYCSSMVWISILFFLTTMKYYRSCEFELQITDILMYFGGSCLYGVQMFKWDKFYKWSRYLHLGTTCTGAACVSVAYLLQQISIKGPYLFFSRWVHILHVVIGIPIGFIFLYLALYYFGGKRRDKMVEKYANISVYQITDEIREDISKLSMTIIWFEVTGLLLGCLAIAAWMWQYDQPCDLGCVGPYKAECAGS